MLVHRKYWRLWAVCLEVLSVYGSTSEVFQEELTIRAHGDGKVSSRFSFSTLLQGATPQNPQNISSEQQSQHYTVFPLTLGQILREFAVTELHLTLNAGNWDYQSWGYPDEPDVGSGAEMWAWMGDGAVATVDERWRGIRNALAGLFCASLGSLDELRTTSPAFSFTPHGALPDWSLPHAMRHASLPSENVCTENLTPFLKLLPCKSLSGIASLLNPHRLFDADWHGMGLHVSWLPDDGVRLRLTFQSVTDPLRLSSHNRDWSFISIFDRAIKRKCPIATSSRVVVELPLDAAYNIHPQPSFIEQGQAIFDLGRQFNAPLDVSMQAVDYFEYATKKLPADEKPLIVRRTLQGSSQDVGTLSVFFTNDGATDIQTAYLETMPWIVQFYLHTLTLRVEGVNRADLLQNISYIPAILHSRPMIFQAVLTVPARNTVHLTIEITKAFLRYTEHPPDAQRGWDLPPAVVVPLSGSGAHHGRRIYTPTLLVDLATPDFSMPYNVIIISCSLVGLIFGTVFNLLARKFLVLRE
ncbi:GPI transamidase component PIG-T [Mycena galericulata]|nr:GPI transamidase component PIG-T [Mycena galericulata]